jgi:hypothetical protein
MPREEPRFPCGLGGAICPVGRVSRVMQMWSKSPYIGQTCLISSNIFHIHLFFDACGVIYESRAGPV